jgi:hypothetical protein
LNSKSISNSTKAAKWMRREPPVVHQPSERTVEQADTDRAGGLVASHPGGELLAQEREADRGLGVDQGDPLAFARGFQVRMEVSHGTKSGIVLDIPDQRPELLRGVGQDAGDGVLQGRKA